MGSMVATVWAVVVVRRSRATTTQYGGEEVDGWGRLAAGWWRADGRHQVSGGIPGECPGDEITAAPEPSLAHQVALGYDTTSP